MRSRVLNLLAKNICSMGWSSVLIVLFICFAQAEDNDDIHGGVKMGEPSVTCDDGKVNIEVDWDPRSTVEYTCTEGPRPKVERFNDTYQVLYKYKTNSPIHKCMNTNISYSEVLPTNGPHRPLWPKYGEYTFCPIQRWMHSLEHGAIVFLYHPCTDQSDVAVLRDVARKCLYRHIISASRDIPSGYNLALLSYRAKLFLQAPDIDAMVEFVTSYAKKGREAVSSDGFYHAGQIHRAELVSGRKDIQLCKSFQPVGQPHKLEVVNVE